MTKSELVSKYGDVVSNAEQCIAYYEKSLGDIPYGDWDEKTCNVIRKDLEKKRQQKKKKEQKETVEVEPPFPMEDWEMTRKQKYIKILGELNELIHQVRPEFDKDLYENSIELVRVMKNYAELLLKELSSDLSQMEAKEDYFVTF